MKINTKQAGERYNLPTSTQWKLRQDNLLPFEKVGKEITYTQEVLDALALEGTLGSKPYLAISNLTKEKADER